MVKMVKLIKAIIAFILIVIIGLILSISDTETKKDYTGITIYPDIAIDLTVKKYKPKYSRKYMTIRMSKGE